MAAPDLVCPFTGEEIKFKEMHSPGGQGDKVCFQAGVDTPQGGWKTSLLPSIEAVEDILTSRVAVPTLPAEEPILSCPFSGKPIDIRQVGGGLYWLGAVKGIFSTSLFSWKEDLVYFLSTRSGIQPLFQRRTEISARKLERAPSDPFADEKELNREFQNEVEKFVDDPKSVLADK